MSQLYHKDDIIRSFDWLGNSCYGYTELVAIHKAYKPGKANFRENLKKKRLPKIWYTKDPHKAIDFVSRYCINHICLIGVNPRPEIFKNKRGFPRSATENDIRVLTNFYFDIDCKDKQLTDEHKAEIELFIAKAEGVFEDIGIAPPTQAFSGRGFHLFFSPAPIIIAKHPDIKTKLIAFKDQFEQTFRKDFDDLGLKLDQTQDLRRMVKIHGTKKPDPNIRRVSRFYGEKRIPDKVLRDYLIGLEIKESDEAPSGTLKYGDIPNSFQNLLKKNKLVNNLWEGTGKTEGDLSNSGYDFSLIRFCIKEGITDINDLASILARRPKGAYLSSGKGESYIKQTISSAVKIC